MQPIPDDLPNLASPQDHLDQLGIIVRMTSSPLPDGQSTAGGVYCSWDGPLAVSLEEAARHVSAVAWDSEHRIYEPFVTTQRYTQYEWGGSAYALEMSVDILNNVGAEMIMAGMGYAIAKLRGRARTNSNPVLTYAADFTEDALTATAAIFSLDRDNLTVLEVAADNAQATLLLQSDGERFHATINRLDTGDPVVIVKRQQ